jgi:ubiquinone/menaquinone biosynthesis C-methylase UbiE
VTPKNKKFHLPDGLDQCRCPTGVKGREVAARMNKGHFDLTTWGLKLVKIEPSFIVLDIGCGGGKTLGRLARRASLGKVYGIDFSPDMVEYSRQINQKLILQNRLNVTQSPVDNTGFKDETFDLVTAVETYYFWPDLNKAFNEIERILKHKGKLLIVSEMIKDGKYEVKNAQIVRKSQVTLLTLREIELILISCGFVNTRAFRKRQSVWNAIVAQKA